MERTPPTTTPTHRTRWLLAASFFVIAALFLLTDVAAMSRWRHVEAETRGMVRDALASVELVARMSRDVDQLRLLVDTHIFESEPSAMSGVEARMGAVRADFADAARAYEPLAARPAERSAWRELQRELAAIDRPLAAALVLSRANRDAEARAAVRALDHRFEDVERQMATLIGANRAEAAAAVTRLEEAQATLARLLLELSAAGVAITLAVGAFAIRAVQRREGQLHQQSLLLEQRNRDLDAFAGRVAHDLRGPLGTLKLAAARLREDGPDGQRAGAVLRRSVERMDALIDDLLALSRSEPRTGCGADPAAAVAHVAEELAARLARDGVALRLAVEPSSVSCSEGLLRQVLSNLLDNAAKYRRAGIAAEVAVSGRAEGERYELRVSDNGSGMSAEEAGQAFEPFYRSPRVGSAPGTGLGLSIVKRVVEASGGKVSVQSRLGEGTTFVVVLPVEPSPAIAPTRPAAAPGGPS